MSVFVYSVFVLLCVQVAALRVADPPSKVSYRLCEKVKKLKKRPISSNKGCRATDSRNTSYYAVKLVTTAL
jgi:hypothetical protein